MLFYSLIPMFLAVVLFCVYYLIYWQSSLGLSTEKASPFECGFDPMGMMRKPFSMRFFILIILFLVFDVEVVLLFPMLIIFKSYSGFKANLIIMMFLVILLVGLLYEWKAGAIDWISS